MGWLGGAELGRPPRGTCGRHPNAEGELVHQRNKERKNKRSSTFRLIVHKKLLLTTSWRGEEMRLELDSSWEPAAVTHCGVMGFLG